ITSAVSPRRVPGLSVSAGLLTPDTQPSLAKAGLRSALAASPISTTAELPDIPHSHAGHSAATYPQHKAITWLPSPHLTAITSPDTLALETDWLDLGSPSLPYLVDAVPRSELQLA
ncbi:Hypothetical predicted protein, partial [Marmota monax]